MTKRPNDETPAPDDWLSIPNNAQAERAERVEVLRRLASRLYSSYLTTPELAALLDENKAPLWAFEELPALAETKRAQRNRKRVINGRREKPLTFDILDAVIDDLYRANGKPPKPGDVYAELSERRETDVEGERKAVSRLLSGDGPRGIWDSEFEMHDAIGGDYMTLSEYIRRRICSEEWARDVFGPGPEEKE